MTFLRSLRPACGHHRTCRPHVNQLLRSKLRISMIYQTVKATATQTLLSRRGTKTECIARGPSHVSSSTIRSLSQPIFVEFSVGMHVAHGRVTYDEARNAYDY
eukprot:PhM_4_TR6250/c0_g1_i1/m.34045